MSDIIYICQLGRRMGKTYAICKAAKRIGATVIVHSKAEAERLKKEYKVQAVSIEDNIRGTKGPYLVDTTAVSFYAQQKEAIIKSLQEALLHEKKQRRYWHNIWALQYEELQKLQKSKGKNEKARTRRRR